ncbi:YhgE/Pip domain-containing protein [Bacillus bombysepticus]|uniref:YhgE/Pip domain-containing protein n=1 Tax=Bacillus bombysepticus TaxID=658666 RepID=UPI00301A6CA7
MKSWKLLRSEWRSILTQRNVLIATLGVLFIPVLYAGMFLWAFWDPYKNLDQLPVAIVNEDTGATLNEKKLTVGDELVNKLKSNRAFDWKFVNEKEAKEGLDDRKYYIMVKIPKDFSKRATTLLDKKPTPLELEYVPNEGTNFLSSQIGETAIEKVRAELSATVSKTYAEQLFEAIKKGSEGFQQAHDGAQEIADGTKEAKDGSVKLKENLQTLASKSIEFRNGVNTAADGSKQLNDGANQLSSGLGQLANGGKQLEDGAAKLQQGSNALYQGLQQAQGGMGQLSNQLPTLVNGSQQLEQGAAKLQTGVVAWQEGANKLQTSAQTLSGGLAKLDASLKPMIDAMPDSPQKQQLQATLGQLVAGSAELAKGAGGLNAGTDTIKNGVTELHTHLNEMHKGHVALSSGVAQIGDGTQKLINGSKELAEGQTSFLNNFKLFGTKLNEAQQGAAKLAEGSTTLNNGMGQLSSGAEQFVSGSQQLADGSVSLNDGLDKLADGTQTLSTKLEDAAKESSIDVSEANYKMLSNPAHVVKKAVAHVPNYGTGFTPYFLSLGLFVGALLTSIIIPLRGSAGTPTTATSWFMSKFGILLVIGTIQALIADVIILWLLDLKVENLGLFVLLSVITSFVFLSLIQMCVTWFGDAGRFIAIIALILQLTTSAGTFPLELVPNALQPVNALLPMTYSVFGFKAVISTGDLSFFWSNVGILLGFLVVTAILTLGYFKKELRKTAK